MPHYGTLHDFAFSKDIDDVRGTALYGTNDDKLGKIDDIIFDHASGDIKYAVVDTGGWFTHKKFLVPADRIHAYGKDKDAFQIDMTKDRIEQRFPKYDEDRLKSDDDWKTFETDYHRAWDTGPVQHQERRLDLNVTPADVSGTAGPGIPMGSMGEVLPDPNPNLERDREALDAGTTPHRIAGKFPEATPSGAKITAGPAHVPSRTMEHTKVGNERNVDRAWEDNPTGASGSGRRQESGVNLNNEFPVDAKTNVTSTASSIGTERHEPAINLQNEFPVDVNPPANPGQRVRSEERLGSAERDTVPGVAGAEVGQWHPRMKRFEDVLRKNRVDVTASCASCKPAKDKVA